MNWLKSYLFSSIGQKQVMAVTGLALTLFLTVHLIGNVLIPFGPQAYNGYSHALVHSPIVWPARIGLFALFVFHVFLAIKVTMENRKARPQGYANGLKRNGEGTFASRTMPLTGIVILLFVVFHIMTFTLGTHYSATYEGVHMRDLHRLVVEVFGRLPQSLLIDAYYIFSAWCVGLHIGHGFGSAFQTLGFHHPRLTPFTKSFSRGLGIVFFLGYSSLPVWSYLYGQGLVGVLGK